DIIVLANYFLTRLAGRLAAVPPLGSAAVNSLLTYPWPGNVRELEHVITAAATLAEGQEIHSSDLRLPGSLPASETPAFSEIMHLPLTEAKERLIESFERARIASALENNQGNVSAAARELGIHRQSLQQKMAQFGIKRA